MYDRGAAVGNSGSQDSVLSVLVMLSGRVSLIRPVYFLGRRKRSPLLKPGGGGRPLQIEILLLGFEGVRVLDCKRTLFEAAKITKSLQYNKASSHTRLSHHLTLLNLIQQPVQNSGRIYKLTNTFPHLASLVKQEGDTWYDNGLAASCNELMRQVWSRCGRRG